MWGDLETAHAGLKGSGTQGGRRAALQSLPSVLRLLKAGGRT